MGFCTGCCNLPNQGVPYAELASHKELISGWTPTHWAQKTVVRASIILLKRLVYDISEALTTNSCDTGQFWTSNEKQPIPVPWLLFLQTFVTFSLIKNIFS